jgi:transcriptional regulator with XRE-family HTH domain
MRDIHDQNQIILQDLLRFIRKAANLSQRELAVRLGKPQSFVSKYESGERRLDILEIVQICKAVNISLVEFSKQLEARLTGYN